MRRAIDEAARQARLLAHEGRAVRREGDLQLRIAVQPGGCSGLRYQLFFDERTLDGDVTTGIGALGLAATGLVLEFLHEHDHTLFPRWPILERSGLDTYRLPEGTPLLPLMYSLLARKAR